MLIRQILENKKSVAEGEDDDISWMTPQQQQEFRSAWEFSKSHPKIWRQYQHYDKLDLEDEFPNKSDQELDILINYILNGLDHGDPNRIMGIGRAVRTIFQWKQEGKQGVAEVSLGDYRKKATMQKAQSQMGAMFNNDPEKQKQYQDTFNKRDRGLNRLKARDEVARKANADKQMSNNIAKLPELRAEYERMKAEYKALGGSNWQYADRDQNLTDRERKARAMEDPMNNLWRTIQSAEKTQRSADDIAETATPGATSAGMIGTVDYPHISPGSSRGKKSYIGSPGKSGTKAPPQPKVNQPKTKHGTAVNALDMKSNIFGGGKAIKRK